MRYLTGEEVLVIDRHGRPIGFYVPTEAGRRDGRAEALERLEQAVQRMIAETGLTEDELSRLFDLNQPLPDGPIARRRAASAIG